MKLPMSARVGIGMMVLLWGTLAHVRWAVCQGWQVELPASLSPSISLSDTNILKFRTSVEKGRFRVLGLSFLLSLLWPEIENIE